MMKTFYHFFTFGLLSTFLLFNASFANVGNQALLPLTELFTNASYEKFLSRYHLDAPQATQLFSHEDILRMLSYFKTISRDEEEFFYIIDLLVLSYPIEQRTEKSEEMISLIDKIFGTWSTNPPSSPSTYQFSLTTNISSPKLNQWIPLLVLTDTTYRGRIDFMVEWRETTNNQRTQVTSSAYFTANRALEDGVQFTAQDDGQIVIADFIKFEKE
ncbi:MAG: hypothetical protein LBD75_05435 [Candidatus Peribacteria bacterium]|jgi:hypothetical protein|nr:hypothetical protein [Candidatus Peribacteria bacterium]